MKTRSLLLQLRVAAVAGVLVGHFFRSFGADLKPIGDGFIKLIKMVIAPLIFCVLAMGIAQLGERGTPVVDLLERVNLALFTVLGSS